MYDPAACLGTELQGGHAHLDPRRRSDADLDGYLMRCPSGFGDGRFKLSLAQVVNKGNSPNGVRIRFLASSARSIL